MNKIQYLRKLNDALYGIDLQARQEILDEFENHFNEGILNGQSEEEIAAELGDPEKVAAELRNLDRTSSPADEFTQAASALAGMIRDTLSAHADRYRSVEKQTPQEYEGTCEKLVSAVQINGELSSVDIRIVPGDALTYHFREGINLFFLNKVIFETETSDNTFLINVLHGHGDLDLTIPPYVDRLELCLTGGDVTIRDLNLLETAFSSKSGDIEMANVETETLTIRSLSTDADLRKVSSLQTSIEQASGDVEMQGCTGALNIKTLSGDIDISDHGGDAVVLDTKSGDIEIETTASRIEAYTLSGDVEIETVSDPVIIEAESKSGDIHIDIPDTDWCAQLKSVSGEIKNKTHRPSFKEGNTMYIGEGKYNVSARSVSGDIRLGKKR